MWGHSASQSISRALFKRSEPLLVELSVVALSEVSRNSSHTACGT